MKNLRLTFDFFQTLALLKAWGYCAALFMREVMGINGKRK
jgi:hypothetical protein